MPEYEAWRESLANTRDANGWDIKYYKGEPQQVTALCLAVFTARTWAAAAYS
jgi:hypothetical protein